MKNKGSLHAYEIDMDYRRDQLLKKKYEAKLKKLNNDKTGIVKEVKK